MHAWLHLAQTSIVILSWPDLSFRMSVKKKNAKTAAKAAAAAKGSGQELHPAGAGQAAIWQEAGTFRNLMKYRASEACKKALLAHCTSTIPV